MRDSGLVARRLPALNVSNIDKKIVQCKICGIEYTTDQIKTATCKSSEGHVCSNCCNNRCEKCHKKYQRKYKHLENNTAATTESIIKVVCRQEGLSDNSLECILDKYGCRVSLSSRKVNWLVLSDYIDYYKKLQKEKNYV